MILKYLILKVLDNFPDYYELSYSYDFLNNSLNLIYGDFDSYKNDNSSNGSNYSFGIDTLHERFYFDLFLLLF